MRYGVLAFLFASVLFADERFTTVPASEGLDLLAGLQHSDFGGNGAGGFRIKGALGRYLGAYAYFSYNPIPNRPVTNLGPVINLIDYGGGLELHASGHRVSPYIFSGIGALRTGFLTFSENNFAGNFGGGVRVYVNRYYGFMADVTTVKAYNNNWIERYSVGIFISLPPARWPGW
jgi:hypothetical protein